MEETNQNNIPIRISVSEAGRLFGVSSKTIRQAIKNNEIHYIVAQGRYKINFESLLLWSQQSTRRRNLLANQGVGQYVDKWFVHNTKYSPSPELAQRIKVKRKANVKTINPQPSESQSGL